MVTREMHRGPGVPETLTAMLQVALIVVLNATLLTAPINAQPSQHGSAGLGGTTGLIWTPTAQILPDASIRFGYFRADKEWAFQDRGTTDNDVYFISFGFLPRIELSLRATVFPSLGLIEEAPFTVDRMGAARLLVLDEGGKRPAVAVGVDDPKGTRRFHSLYIVGTKTLTREVWPTQIRVSGGYGSTAIDARRYILDGGFGGVEVVYGDLVGAALEYDTEKWNTNIRLYLFDRLAVHLAFLNLETPSGGFSWTQRF